VKGGLKVHPSKMSIIALLGKQDICNEVVPIEEPPGVKDIENVEHRELVGSFLSSIWSRTRRR